jgi:hypothetical protein
MPNKPIRGTEMLTDPLMEFGCPWKLHPTMPYYYNYLARLKGGRVKILPFLALEKPRLDITKKSLQYVSWMCVPLGKGLVRG